MATSTLEPETARGRDARAPRDIPARGWKDILWRTYRQFGEDRIMLVAAGVTFYGLLALIPALAAFISVYGLFFDPQDVSRQVGALGDVLPGGAVSIIQDQASRIAAQGSNQLSFTFALGLLISLWSANAGVKSVIDALNVAYDEDEKRSFLRLNAVSLLFTLSAIAFLIVALAGIAVIPVVLQAIGLGGMAGTLLQLGRWPVLLLLVIGALAVLYRYGPSRERPRWQWITWGSFAAAIGWLVFSLLFSWYVSNFGSYNETYGSLGAVIGFMTWMWLSATIVLVGAELNSEIEHQTSEDTTTGPEAAMGNRGAKMADTVGESV